MRSSLTRSLPRLTDLQEAAESWLARGAGIIRMLEARERKRLAAHGFALGAVAAAAVLRGIIAVAAGEPPFWLFHAAVAVTAARGVAAAALTAALGSVLIERLLGGASLTDSVLFLVEALTLALVVLRLVKSVEEERRRMTAIEPWMRELKSTERQARLVDSAFSWLDQAAETVVVILDPQGRIRDWRTGATRLYGFTAAQVVGMSPSALFGQLCEEAFARLMADARQGSGRYAGHQRRADGTTFEAEIDIRPLSRGGFDGFAMIVRDLTRHREYSQLQEEAAAAHRQLSTLRHVTDPALNSLPANEFMMTLVERLRSAIQAEGVAVVYMDRLRRRVLCAAGGVQCERGVARAPLDLRRFDAGRTVLIHNDPAAVLESSAAAWPSDVSSMMAVPVVRAGSAQAVMEVVNRTGRRATEWEIVLVQVVAARIAGFLQEERYADSGAVA